MQSTYIVLGINGTDPTATENTATIRLFNSIGVATDQQFTLPALTGADASIAPTNFQDQYVTLIQDDITTAIGALG